MKKGIKTALTILLLLLLIAAALIFKPEIILLVLRYGLAALNVILAVCLII